MNTVSRSPVLALISAGAAQGLVRAVAGEALAGSFGAVGTQLDKYLQGEPCDLLILTRAQLDELAARGELLPGSVRNLGQVPTGVAVRAGTPLPAVADAASLKAALSAADAFYVPDLQRSTAGQHIARVLRQLGLEQAMAARVRMFPNGATAMREMAASADARPIGCTQVTEILYTPGVQLAGALAGDFALSTLYAVGVPVRSRQPAAAAEWAERLSGPVGLAARREGGFV